MIVSAFVHAVVSADLSFSFTSSFSLFSFDASPRPANTPSLRAFSRLFFFGCLLVAAVQRLCLFKFCFSLCTSCVSFFCLLFVVVLAALFMLMTNMSSSSRSLSLYYRLGFALDASVSGV